MALTSGVMLGHPDVHGFIRQQAGGFLTRFSDAPVIGRIFASHQRWLLAHIALMLYCETGQIVPARFFDHIEDNAVASRNTADAFLKEMETYGIANVTASSDRRSRPLIPSDFSIGAAIGWLELHLETLDRFDGGNRMMNFQASGRDFRRIHPLIATEFMQTPELREQPKIFDPFIWLNNGNIIIDWMMANSRDGDDTAQRISVGVVSIQKMSETFHLSRTHLTRKLLDAAKLGTIGWVGARGRSELWMSNEFRMEYARAQTVKLEIIDRACARCGFL
ncbi:AraC-like DNA-binding protein [Agrobacterium vitis]|nr:AraC-like DNA-binding protein [Agrobacterium vitis]MBE1439549.1 AraC-like DNA-binding protein [Agrobacterium vitis]